MFAKNHIDLFSSKIFNYIRALAGLLTCPRFEPPSHIPMDTVAKCVKTLQRTYSSGSVQDLHLIPLTNAGAKIEKRFISKKALAASY